jgi:CIC family chloride channel protein
MKAHTIYDGKVILGDVATTSIFTIYPDQSLLVALLKLEHYHVSHLPVVSRLNDKKLIGIVTALDIINRFGASR